MNAHIVPFDFQGHAVAFNSDGWINATEAAARFGKLPHEWLRLPETTAYLGTQAYRHVNLVYAAIPSKILALFLSKYWAVHYETRISNRVTRGLRAHSVSRSNTNDRALSIVDCPIDRCERLSSSSTINSFHYEAGPCRVCACRSQSLGQSANRNAGKNARIVAASYKSRYGSPAAVSPAAEFGDSNFKLAHMRPKTIAGAFFVPAMLLYGGRAWETFGSAGCQLARFANPRTAATHNRLATVCGSSITQVGALPMKHALNPSSHAAAWKSRALAALRANSSLSVRLARYNAAMARARALEAQGACHE